MDKWVGGLVVSVFHFHSKLSNKCNDKVSSSQTGSECASVCIGGVCLIWWGQWLPVPLLEQTAQGWASAAALLRKRRRPCLLSAHQPPVSRRRLTWFHSCLWPFLFNSSIKTRYNIPLKLTSNQLTKVFYCPFVLPSTPILNSLLLLCFVPNEK